MSTQISENQSLAVIEFPVLTYDEALKQKVKYFSCKRPCRDCGDIRRVVIDSRTAECYSCLGQYANLTCSAAKQKDSSGNGITFNGRFVWRNHSKGRS